uniref:DDE Tnp4 domain-containing protein n=1 Tax=Cacopsylla melanoneura TaxID=428564 RepID=A0A8D9BC61_9HEMI
MTPYKERAGKVFNYHLSKVWVRIEQTFGRLKGIFRRVKHLECKKVKNSTQLIVLACILHNIVIDSNIDIAYEEDMDTEDFNEPGAGGHEVDENQRQRDKRDAIIFRDHLKNSIIEAPDAV